MPACRSAPKCGSKRQEPQPRNKIVTKCRILLHIRYERCAMRACHLRDDREMDGLEGNAAQPPLDGSERPRDRIAVEFGRIMGHTADVQHARDPAAIDVATYLLNPPPSPQELDRRARHRRLVGVLSLAACIVLALVLVAPWPSDVPHEQPAHATERATPHDEPAAPTVEALPKRLDVPGHRVRATRLDAPSAHVPAPSRRPRATHPRAARSAARAPVRTPRPSRTPAASDTPTMLVPLS